MVCPGMRVTAGRTAAIAFRAETPRSVRLEESFDDLDGADTVGLCVKVGHDAVAQDRPDHGAEFTIRLPSGQASHV